MSQRLAYQKRWRRRRDLSGGLPLLIPVELAAAHIGRLHEQGTPLAAIAREAGLDHDHIYRIASGRTKWLQQKTHRRVMSVRHAEGFYVDATGTHRRLEALVWLGWPLRHFDRVRGVAPCATARILTKTTITRPTADEIAELYRTYSGLLPDPKDRHEKMAVTQARLRARRLGYAPPAAWDDETIDDPRVKPQGVAA